MSSLYYNTLFETPYNENLVKRMQGLQERKEYYNPTEPHHISYYDYPSVNGSGRDKVIYCGGARGDPRSLGFEYDPRYLRSGSTSTFPVYHFDDAMATSSYGGVRCSGFHYHDDFNPYYNRVVSANQGSALPSFSRGGSKIGKFFKSVGHALAPVGRAVMPVVKEVGKDLLKDAVKGAILGAGKKPRGRPRKVVGVGRFEGSGHPSGSPIPNDIYVGNGVPQLFGAKERKSKKVKQLIAQSGGVREEKKIAESIWNDLIQPHTLSIKYGMKDKTRDLKKIEGLLKSHTEDEVRVAINMTGLKGLSGGSFKTFFRKVGNTLKSIGHAVAPVAVPVLKEVGKDLLKGAIMGSVVGLGRKRGRPKKMSGAGGESVDSAGILSVTPNPPPALQVVGGKSNIGRKIKNTFKKVGKFLQPAVPVLKEIGTEVLGEAKKVLKEEGKKAVKEAIKSAVSSEGAGTNKGQVRKTARKAYEGKADKKINARAEIVKKIMKEKGMKMIDASKYVKEHNLYKK